MADCCASLPPCLHHSRTPSPALPHPHSLTPLPRASTVQQVTSNRSLDGVLDQLNSKHLTDAGPLQLIDHDAADSDQELLPPGGDPAAAADLPGSGAGRRRAAARTRALALSPTGASWAAATTEGLLLYALDSGAAFDPTDLNEALTPAAFHAAVAAGAHGRALLVALRLGDARLLRHGLLSVPPERLGPVARGLPPLFLTPLLAALSDALADSPHAEFLLRWTAALLTAHGPTIEAAAGGGIALRAVLAGGGPGSAAAAAAAASGDASAAAAGAGGGAGALLAALRSLQQAVTRLHRDVAATAEANVYALEYLLASARLQQCSDDNPLGAELDAQQRLHVKDPQVVEELIMDDEEEHPVQRGSIKGKKQKKKKNMKNAHGVISSN